ncbi:hypothetical protein KUV57_11070 [Epibacterium sp. DP7N7-1]|nr:hypothetical protein [Epibacterium sp. DP7N7-1]
MATMSRKYRLKNLQIDLEICGLILHITPFRWAKFAFKTQRNIIGKNRSNQLFAGPLHVWTFPREGELVVRFGLNLKGSVHGTFTPSGDDAIHTSGAGLLDDNSTFTWSFMQSAPAQNAPSDR